MKHIFFLTTFSMFFQSETMHRDPRVWPQMKRLGLHDEHFSCSDPEILFDGKKVYYAKGQVNGLERIVRVRYKADDTLDTSFGQGGVEIGEQVDQKVTMTQIANAYIKS